MDRWNIASGVLHYRERGKLVMWPFYCRENASRRFFRDSGDVSWSDAVLFISNNVGEFRNGVMDYYRTSIRELYALTGMCFMLLFSTGMFMLTLNYETVRYDRYFCVFVAVKLCSCIMSRVATIFFVYSWWMVVEMVVLCDAFVTDGHFSTVQRVDRCRKEVQ